MKIVFAYRQTVKRMLGKCKPIKNEKVRKIETNIYKVKVVGGILLGNLSPPPSL